MSGPAARQKEADIFRGDASSSDRACNFSFFRASSSLALRERIVCVPCAWEMAEWGEMDEASAAARTAR